MTFVLSTFLCSCRQDVDVRYARALRSGGGGPTLMDPLPKTAEVITSPDPSQITAIKDSGLGHRLPLRRPPNLASPPARQSQKFVPAPFSGCCSPCHPCHVNMGACLSFAAVCSPELTCTRRPAMAPFQRAIRSLQNAEKAHDKWIAPISAEAPAAIPAVVECATC